MKRMLIIIATVTFLTSYRPAIAVTNPLNVPNNTFGIHILFPHELEESAKLVNSSGGDYGYVTIAIQSGDKDIKKWQNFLDEAKRLHLIPIIRLATEGDFQNTAVWRKPTDYDIVDFANFLDSLNWPYKNRYIIIFNEVNRGDEWGGSVNPKEYAEILNYAVTVFKSKNQDFFIISAGLDNAAPNRFPFYMNQYNYFREMNASIPGIFSQIDGFASHSYPNPGFSQLPLISSPMGANSFQYEKLLIKTLTNRDIPIFITETGWATDIIHHDTAAHFYEIAFNSVWSDPSVVAVTPFLLQGSGGPFQKFSFLDSNGASTSQYHTIKKIPKKQGNPLLNSSVLSSNIQVADQYYAKYHNFSDHQITTQNIILTKEVKNTIKWLLKL